MKKLLFASLLLAISSVLSAQEYQRAIGVRAGYGLGVTFKTALGGDNAAEFILQTRYRGFNVTGLYEKHYSFFDVPNTMWYIGGGAHLGVYNNRKYKDDEERNGTTTLGLDGIIGVELALNQAPLSFSLDWKPIINVVGWTGFGADGGALSIRYVIN